MKIFIHTHGCSNNYYETEVIKGVLKKHEFDLVKDPKKAEIIIINICTVKGIETAIRTIRKYKQNFPESKIIIAGCISKDIIPEIRNLDEKAPLVNTHNILHIVEVIEELNQGNVLEAITRTNEEKINIPTVRFNNTIGIVPIAQGCVDYCTYCSVKLIKGHIQSYPQVKILKEINNALDHGVKEIWLTSQDNGAYGMEDKTHKLPQLLKTILKIKKDFFIRLGMLNPHHALEMLDELIEIYQDVKMFKFIHLPVESGSNEILTLMKRKYNIYDYKDMIDKLRQKIPHITIATDIIVGFPTETEVEFHDSINLINEIKPDVLNISRFHARTNTKASKMEQVPGGEIKDRSRELTSLYHNISYENNKKWFGWEGPVLVDGKGKNNTSIARNFAYKQVILEGEHELGKLVKVKINNIGLHDLKGEIIENN